MVETDAVLEKAASLKAAGKPFALVTVVRCESPTSAKPGAKAVVEPDGSIEGWIGGGCAQPAVIKMAKQAVRDGEARLIRISPSQDQSVAEGMVEFGMTCHSGGTLDIFIDPIVARPALLIIGASPAAQALASLARRVGFAVTAAARDASRETFPEAERIINTVEVAELTAGGTPGLVVVATQGKRDEAGLEAALATGAGYIAFIASARKSEKLKQYLKELGHHPARVDAIVAPAGVEIGAVTPEEIALSVLAGVVQVRRSGRGKTVTALSAAQGTEVEVQAHSCCGAEDKSEATTPAEVVDPVCGMTVAVGTADYSYEFQGQTYYFCCGGCEQAFAKAPEKYLGAAGV